MYSSTIGFQWVATGFTVWRVHARLGTTPFVMANLGLCSPTSGTRNHRRSGSLACYSGITSLEFAGCFTFAGGAARQAVRDREQAHAAYPYGGPSVFGLGVYGKRVRRISVPGICVRRPWRDLGAFGSGRNLRLFGNFRNWPSLPGPKRDCDDIRAGYNSCRRAFLDWESCPLYDGALRYRSSGRICRPTRPRRRSLRRRSAHDGAIITTQHSDLADFASRARVAMPSKPTLRPEQVSAILTPFGVKLSDHQIAAFSRYLDLIIRWNRVVSLTAVNDPEEIVERHFGESIFAASIVPLHGRLADVGSGAGFPGVPLKILAPEMEVLLLEPNLKKSVFLIELCAALDLKRIEITRRRYEDKHPHFELFDIIASRALGDYKRMLRWARPALRNGGQLVLWLGEQDATVLAKVAGWNWSLPVRIPGSRRRVVLTGQTQL